MKIIKHKQHGLFDVVDKIEQSTGTITELRIPIFAPVLKLSGNSVTAQEFKKNGGVRTIKTSWGRVEIRGRKLLTQVHRDLLDCIYTHATTINQLPGGEVNILFSQTKILKEYSGDEKSNSWEKQTKWLRDKIKEIRDITINYVDTKGNSFDFNLISHLDYNEEYKAYSITLDKRYLKFYGVELTINYKEELPKLLKEESALIKAIVRWFFTHREKSTFKLMTVLEALAFPIDSPKTLQTAKREIKQKKEELLSFGIDYNHNSEIFYYNGNPSIGFIPSLQSKVKGDANLITTKLKHAKDFCGMKILMNEIEVTINDVLYEVEGAFISSIKIVTTGEAIEMFNESETSQAEFEMEVILYLESLLV